MSPPCFLLINDKLIVLELFLAPDQVEKLHDFEEECMEDYARQKEYEKNRSNEERLHRTAERTDLLLVRMNDLITKETSLKSNVNMLESRIEMIEDRQNEMLDCLRQITSALPSIVSALQQPRGPTPLGDIPPPSTSSKPSYSDTNDQVSRQPDVAIEITGSQSTNVGVMTSGTDSNVDAANDNTRRRLRTSTISGHEVSAQTPPPNTSKLFGSILSLDKNAYSNVVQALGKSGSVRRRPHDEYTSITDGIVAIDKPKPRTIDYHHDDSDNNDLPLRTEAEEEDEEDYDPNMIDGHFAESDLDTSRDTPTTTLKRAKPSFLQRQNTVLKEYEESVGGHYNVDEVHSSNDSSPEPIKRRVSTLKVDAPLDRAESDVS